MTFRDDHEAAVQRIAALEEELARTQRERDRYRSEADAARKLPPGSSAESARIAALEQALAAALDEGSRASEALALAQPADVAKRRSSIAGALGLVPLASGAAISLALGAIAPAVACFAGMSALVYWSMRRDR